MGGTNTLILRPIGVAWFDASKQEVYARELLGTFDPFDGPATLVESQVNFRGIF